MENRTEYNADEFLGFENEVNETFTDEVEKKVSLLYDFAILSRRKFRQPDEREEAVRKLLEAYGSPILMDNAVRDILMGKVKLNDALKRKGYLQ